MTELLWLIVVAVAVILLVAIVAKVVTGRRTRPAFAVRSLPASYLESYRTRMTEIQALFVNHPREAVAAAKQVVDDMTMRMGYPTRLTDRERMADLASVDRGHAERYGLGVALKPDSSTEELRRALQSYLELAREILDRPGTDAEAATEGGRPEIAG